MSPVLNALLTRSAEPARWLIVAGIAWTLASSVMFFVSGPNQVAVAPSPGITVATPGAQPRISINTIVSRNLFGAADAVATTAESAAPTVETRLPLELSGVFVADEAADSVAIVAQKGKSGELYGVGDTLPGNAELIEVHADHVVLRRAGVRETLTFPTVTSQFVADVNLDDDSPDTGLSEPDYTEPQDYDQGYDQGAEEYESTQPPDDGAAQAGGSVHDAVSQYRDQIAQDPEGALQQLGLEAVSSSGAEGYRLGALADSPYLSQTGLQPGDVVLSVNGQPVGNVRQDQQQIDNILAQGSARLEVQRGTRRFFVTASLKQ